LTGLVTLPLDDLTFGFGQIQEVRLGTMVLTTLHGLEIIPGDDTHTFAVEGMGAQARLLFVDVNSGIAQDYGPLSDPTQLNATPQPRRIRVRTSVTLPGTRTSPTSSCAMTTIPRTITRKAFCWVLIRTPTSC
jgi:hypothetical protein